jgi:hypothetical protein
MGMAFIQIQRRIAQLFTTACHRILLHNKFIHSNVQQGDCMIAILKYVPMRLL